VVLPNTIRAPKSEKNERQDMQHEQERTESRKAWKKGINYERVGIAITLCTHIQDASYPE
jgi:hypothetical protein